MVNLCDYAHCWHAVRSRWAMLVAALTPWVVVRCCQCGKLKLKPAKTPHVKA